MPEEIRLEWSRESEGKEADLDHLMEFLEKEIHRRERSQSLVSFGDHSNAETKKAKELPFRKRVQGTAAALQIANNGMACDFCNRRNHSNFKCYKFLALQVKDREDLVEKHKLCFKCLSKGHLAKSCNNV